MKGECDVLKEKEKARDKKCEEFKAKCEAAMEDFDNNPAVNVLHKKIKSLSDEVKEHKAIMSWRLPRPCYAKKLKLLKFDRAEVVSKAVPYVAKDLVHSDDMAMFVGKLVSSAVFYERCAAFEEVADMKEPFDLVKVKGYRPSYKKEHTKARNDLATTTFPILSKFIADPSALVEALLSKKSKSIHRPTPTKTHGPALSVPSQKATPSTTHSPKPMSPLSAIQKSLCWC
ncbi:hypothetical protein Tco_0290613 [Tanacetum coccineum]